MRNAFIEALCELAARDERIWLLTGDLGFSVLECFAERFPSRFLNAGVAEQAMTGIATGLAMSGKIVFTYSIANFPTLRCLEQIRNDVCYHNANVKVVAVGGGLAYGAQGYTHHGVEDLAIMGALPNMTVIAPGDPVETRLATEAIAAHVGPCYLRLGRGGERAVHTEVPAFKVGCAIVLRDGGDLTIISTGGMLGVAVEAGDHLAAEGISAAVVSCHTIKPIDHDAILRMAGSTRHVITIEEHSATGGLGSAVAGVLAKAGLAGVSFCAIALPEKPLLIGSQQYLCEQAGLTPEAVAARARALLGRA